MKSSNPWIFAVRKGLAWCLIWLGAVGCSWIATDRSSVNGGEQAEQTSETGDVAEEEIGETVEREKYLSLLQENRELRAKLGINSPTVSVPAETQAMVNDLASTTPATVSLGPETAQAPDIHVPAQTPAIIDDGTVASAVQRLQQAMQWQQAGQGGEALKVYQDLEKSPSKQVQVRAKFQTGLLFFSQKEYDLALQSFETIIKNYAFSGLVIKSVEFSMLCSEKLGLVEKKEQYQSILRDIFKANT